MMDLTPYTEQLRRELAVAAEAAGDDARALAERLTAPLESAVRLMLLEALSAAADEITVELAPASVVVPYQYSMIVWAVMFGYAVFGDVPEVATVVGAAIIIGAGIYIFFREQALGREEPAVNPPA